MTVFEQLEIIKEIYQRKISLIYQQEFFLRLTAVMFDNQRWFENQLSQIDILSALIETSIMSSNPRRAMQYLCILNTLVKRLTECVNDAYSAKFRKIL